MTDLYEVEAIRRLLRSTVMNGGMVLVQLAAMSSITCNQGGMPHSMESLINKKAVMENLQAIREYVNSYYQLIKDYRCRNYMNFYLFTMKTHVGDMYADQRGTNYYELTGKYVNFDNYFIDTVKNVLTMSQDMRDSVATLFVGNHYDVKLNQVKNLVSPDTLIITGMAEEGVQVPFLPSVRKIAVIGYYNTLRKRHHGNARDHSVILLLDNYLETITDLSVDLFTLDNYYINMIEKCTQLESVDIRIEDVTQDIYSKIALALYKRRQMNMSEIKAFRFTIVDEDNINIYSVLPLLDELQHHPLEALSLKLYRQSVEMKDIANLVFPLKHLETLIIALSDITITFMLEQLQGMINNVTSLVLFGDDSPSDDEAILKATNDMTNLKVIVTNGILNEDIEEIIKRNKVRSRSLFGAPLLSELVPNGFWALDTKNTDNVLGMNDTDNFENERAMELLYSYNKSDLDLNPHDDFKNRITIMRQLEEKPEVYEYDSDDY